MKYGESVFDIGYLAFAIISGCIILKTNNNKAAKLMGIAVLILGIGDSFHLIPRVLNYFTDLDMNAALGIGKLITSLTMTAFYYILYRIWLILYDRNENKNLTLIVYILIIARIALCLFPQNRWITNEGSVLWGILRNIPFMILGGIVCYLYFSERMQIDKFKYLWLYILLSFLFYIPVAFFASIIPMFGMLMLPKTICYILMIYAFLKYTKQDRLSDVKRI
ncbi:MAG: hypothetical protein K6G12_04070 [Lachnospiraceae bacterium]|nr:hypothetical protein [Lachnospiraceae bacterium]